jgi:hypothetical protein
LRVGAAAIPIGRLTSRRSRRPCEPLRDSCNWLSRCRPRLAIAESILSDTKGLRRHFRVALLPLPPKPRRAALIRNASLIQSTSFRKTVTQGQLGCQEKVDLFERRRSTDPLAGAGHCAEGRKAQAFETPGHNPDTRPETRRVAIISFTNHSYRIWRVRKGDPACTLRPRARL